jgi:hypothetical protein
MSSSSDWPPLTPAVLPLILQNNLITESCRLIRQSNIRNLAKRLITNHHHDSSPQLKLAALAPLHHSFSQNDNSINSLNQINQINIIHSNVNSQRGLFPHSLIKLINQLSNDLVANSIASYYASNYIALLIARIAINSNEKDICSHSSTGDTNLPALLSAQLRIWEDLRIARFSTLALSSLYSSSLLPTAFPTVLWPPLWILSQLFSNCGSAAQQNCIGRELQGWRYSLYGSIAPNSAITALIQADLPPFTALLAQKPFPGPDSLSLAWENLQILPDFPSFDYNLTVKLSEIQFSLANQANWRFPHRFQDNLRAKNHGESAQEAEIFTNLIRNLPKPLCRSRDCPLQLHSAQFVSNFAIEILVFCHLFDNLPPCSCISPPKARISKSFTPRSRKLAQFMQNHALLGPNNEERHRTGSSTAHIQGNLADFGRNLLILPQNNVRKTSTFHNNTGNSAGQTGNSPLNVLRTLSGSKLLGNSARNNNLAVSVHNSPENLLSLVPTSSPPANSSNPRNSANFIAVQQLIVTLTSFLRRISSKFLVNKGEERTTAQNHSEITALLMIFSDFSAVKQRIMACKAQLGPNSVSLDNFLLFFHAELSRIKLILVQRVRGAVNWSNLFRLAADYSTFVSNQRENGPIQAKSSKKSANFYSFEQKLRPAALISPRLGLAALYSQQKKHFSPFLISFVDFLLPILEICMKLHRNCCSELFPALADTVFYSFVSFCTEKSANSTGKQPHPKVLINIQGALQLEGELEWILGWLEQNPDNLMTSNEWKSFKTEIIGSPAVSMVRKCVELWKNPQNHPENNCDSGHRNNAANNKPMKKPKNNKIVPIMLPPPAVAEENQHTAIKVEMKPSNGYVLPEATIAACLAISSMRHNKYINATP